MIFYSKITGRSKKSVFVMNLTITGLLLLITTFRVNGNAYGQNLTIDQNRFSINLVFKEIKRQTGYDILWQNGLLNANEIIKGKIKKIPLQTVLNLCLKGKNLTYVIQDNSIIIKRVKDYDKDVLKITQDSLIYSGKVLDNLGNPLVGATVRIQYDLRGYLTDSNGEFRIFVPKQKAKLLISYIGYSNKEIILNGSTTKRLLIEMSPVTGSLAEVQVVSNGYQDIPKERATGSFEVITAKQLEHSTSPSLLKRLEGITTSLNFNNQNTPTIAGNTTLIGKNPLANLTIRGKNTLNQNSDAFNFSGLPLLVIDGIASAYNIDQIDPNDVESITILKDAAAASIWGSRAANGVLVVKTKRGRYNQPVAVSFNSSFNITEKPDLFYNKKMSTSDFIDAQILRFTQSGTNLANPTISNPRRMVSPVDEILDAWINKHTLSENQANLQLDELRKNDVRSDISKYILRDENLQTYSLGISGGSKSIAYRISGSFNDAINNVVGTGNNRYIINYSASAKPVKNLEIQAVIGYTRQLNKYQGPRTTVNADYLRFYPYQKLADDNGNALALPNKYRPSFVSLLNSTYGSKILDMTYKPLEEINFGSLNYITNGFNMGLNSVYTFNKFLSANVSYSYNSSKSQQETYYSKDSYYVRELVNRFTDPSTLRRNIPYGGIDINQNTNSTTNTVRGQLNYNQSWSSKHILNAIGGIDISKNYNELIGYQYYGYDPKTLIYNNNLNFSTNLRTLWSNPINGLPVEQIPPPPTLNYYQFRTISSYGNFAYSYDNRYVITGSIRKDGSSALGISQNKTGKPFYSLGMSWNIANEIFYNFPTLSTLILRATYGYNGNTNSITYPRPRIAYSNNILGDNGLPYAIVSTTEATNNNLRPERTGVLNLGLDYGFKNGRLSGSLEYYIKNTKDLITENKLDPTTGFSSLPYNTGDLRGYGIDFTLNSQNIKLNKFNWTTNFLLSYNRVKVEKLYVPGGNFGGFLVSGTGSQSYTVGYDLSRIFAYPWAGLDPSNGNARILLSGRPLTISNDQQGTDNYNSIFYSSPSSVKYIGSAVPVYFGSIRNTFSLNKISISANILYKLKYFVRRPFADVVNYTLLYQGNGQLLGGEFANRWKTPGDERSTNVPSLNYPGNGAQDELYYYSDINVVKGDHVRLQEINCSYGISGENRFLKNIRLYANVSNLGIIWRANKLGIDPEVNDIPQPRIYSFGLSANFN